MVIIAMTGMFYFLETEKLAGEMEYQKTGEQAGSSTNLDGAGEWVFVLWWAI